MDNREHTSFRDQNTIRLDRLGGLWVRGSDDIIPIGHFSVAQNILWDGDSWVRRPGAGLEYQDGSNPIVSAYQYISQDTGDPRHYFFTNTNSPVQLFSSENTGVALISWDDPQLGDFKVIKVFGKYYVTPVIPGSIGAPILKPNTGARDGLVHVILLGRVATFTITLGGGGYTVGDIITLPGIGDGNCKLKVATLGGGGSVATATISHPGTNYIAGQATFTTGGTGTLCKITVNSISRIAFKAAGSKPDGFTLGVANGAAGKVEAGRHLWAVAYETESGFITRPGPTSWTLFRNTGKKKINISAIPIGPSNIVARHILASKLILKYNKKNFNQIDHELFFIPNGRVDDNTATTLTVDFFDSELLSSADYLNDQLEEIPAFSDIVFYNGKMVGCGENYAPYVVRASKTGAPESFDQTSGFSNVYPDDAPLDQPNKLSNGVTSVVLFRGSLMLIKQTKTYITRDNGSDISTWRIDLVDASIGCSAFGYDIINNFGGPGQDYVLVAHESGIRLFDGTYRDLPLTYKVRDLYTLQNNYKQLIYPRLLFDAVSKIIYFRFLEDGIPGEERVLIGDAKDGFTITSLTGVSQNVVRWSTMKFPVRPGVIFLGLDYNTTTSLNRLCFTNSANADIAP